jgi:hypothetical protein
MDEKFDLLVSGENMMVKCGCLIAKCWDHSDLGGNNRMMVKIT